jgi:hypothetical protein
MAVGPLIGGQPALQPGRPAPIVSDVSPSTPWWSYRRIAANGRIEVSCRATGEHLYWLTPRELADWTVCAHCVGWVSHWPAPVPPR